MLALGLDDALWLQPPLGYVEAYNADLVPGVESRVTLTPAAGGSDYPLLTKEYETPDGLLRQIVTMTDDWPYGKDIFVFSDFNVSRSKEYLIKEQSDARRLRWLLGTPDPAHLQCFHDDAGRLVHEAQHLGVALEGGWSALGDAAVWLCGMENVLVNQLQDPDIIEAVLDTVLEWELKRIDLLLAAGIDIHVHMAWYEGSDFWTPTSFRRFIKPRLKQMIDRVHQGGVLFRYIITKGWLPIVEDLLEIGIDCLSGLDPIQDAIDPVKAKQLMDQKICVMGGVNSAIMFSQWSDDEITEAVKNAIQIFSPGSGFILYPVDQIFTDTPWSKVEVLINAWKNFGFKESI
jgi:hypothetical protein